MRKSQINFGWKFEFRSYLSYYNCILDATSKMIWGHCTGRNIFDVRKFQWLSQELNKLRESLRKSSLPFWSRKSVKTCLNWNSFMLLGSSSLAVAVECPMLWRITKHSLHNEGICKWVNWAPIFFWYKLLQTTYGPQQFAKIGVVKVDYFDLP